MSLAACIATLHAEGKLDKERVDRYGRELAKLEASYAKQFNKVAAAEMAGRDFISRLEAEAAQGRRQTLLQLGAQTAIQQGMTGHVKAGGKAGQYAIALFDHHEAVPGVSNIYDRHIGIKQLAWSHMGDFLVKFKRDLVGNMRFASDLDDMVRELHGQATGNKNAAELAQAFTATSEWLRQQFNAAGGHIDHLKGWALPQAHDSLAIGKAGFQAWRDFIKPLLDPTAMHDGATGKLFTDEGLDEALNQTWRSIASDGLDKMEPGQMTGAKLASQRADARFLSFKNAEAWMAYQKRFGRGDAFNAITGHIDGMSKDIAAMQVLGPNPGLTVRWLGDMLRKGAAPTIDGGKSLRLEKGAAKAAKETDRMWRYYRGELTQPDPTNRGTARFFSGLRNWNVASDLGSAFLSAVGTDPVFATYTAKFNGLDATRLIANYAQAMNPLDAAGRAEALHAGIVFNEMTTSAERLWREDTAMRLNVHEVTRRLADGVMRVSLLAPHTVAMKTAVSKSFMMDMADHAGKAFDALDTVDQRRFQRYGIDAADWDYIRETPVYEQEGHRLLRPGDVASRDSGFGGRADKAAFKMLEMMSSEGRFATPGESLRAQTMLALGGKNTRFERGTYLGELAHSATQFKTYSVIAILTHMQRAIYGNTGMGSRLAYSTLLPLFLTLGGAAVLAMKDVAFGKDPEPMTTPKFWGRALVQGGGAGIVGDFISAGVSGRSRTGGTIAGFLAGPTIANVVDPALDLVLGNAGKLGSDKETDLRHEATKMAGRNIPGGNIWYLNLAMHRLMLDHLSAAADPKFPQSYARMKRAAAEQGTQYYWQPGADAPDRAPNLDNALGNQGTAQ